MKIHFDLSGTIVEISKSNESIQSLEIKHYCEHYAEYAILQRFREKVKFENDSSEVILPSIENAKVSAEVIKRLAPRINSLVDQIIVNVGVERFIKGGNIIKLEYLSELFSENVYDRNKNRHIVEEFNKLVNSNIIERLFSLIDQVKSKPIFAISLNSNNDYSMLLGYVSE